MGDDIKAKSDKKNSKRFLKIIGIVSIVVMVLAFASLNYFTKNYLYNGKIAENIYIQGIEVSNLSKDEAINLVKKKYTPQDLTLKYNDSSYTIKSKDINLQYDTEKLIDEAYNITRTGSYFNDIISYISTKINKKDYNIGITYDDERLNESIESISSDINQEVSNAKVDIYGGSIRITPSVEGRSFKVNENKKIISEVLKNKNYENVDLQVDVTKPKISTEDVSSINSCLASFSTKFNSSQKDRSHNIGLAAQKISKVLLLPGQTFSYNDQTGPRTLSNGFKNAPVILKGELEDAPGGGVCQTSTTLFNAVLLSGLQIDQVRNHSLTPSYVPRGRDAMVSDGGSDFKFTNNFDHAVYVESYRSGDTVTAAIYGASQDRVGVSIDVDEFKYNNLPAAKTYRTITKNGKSTKSYIYTSVYKR
ncbi:VanW family protein [Terrisporobacter sp.]|uniref:VanW family protein n=1 Tax=Terrisporobacter sp. TaxID=1965305 RepID=UPI0026370943|nr:VanW family protein [Terrisporobacter sp.]